jgi:hypothetical protein
LSTSRTTAAKPALTHKTHACELKTAKLQPTPKKFLSDNSKKVNNKKGFYQGFLTKQARNARFLVKKS